MYCRDTCTNGLHFFFQLTKKVHLLLWDVFIADYLNGIDARGHRGLLSINKSVVP